MKYNLKHKNGETFETDLWVMADRKIASGWKLCLPSEKPEVKPTEKKKAPKEL